MTAAVWLAALAAGGVGALARWATTLAVARRSRRDLPWAVLIVNAAGSLLGGVVLGLSYAGALDDGVRLVLLGGVAGGLTTFGTLAVETVQLWSRGRRRVAVTSVLANLAVGLALAASGFALGGLAG